MIVLEKEINGAALKTTFELDEKFTLFAKDVLSCLEGKKVKVLKDVNNVIEISILEWLPIVLSNVRFSDSRGKYVIPVNFIQILSVLSLMRQQQSAIFAGEIKINIELTNSDAAFKYVFAHELQHAIDQLYHAHYAVTDWQGFLHNVLRMPDMYKIEDDEEYIENFGKLVDQFYKIRKGVDIMPNNEKIRALKTTFGASIEDWHKSYIEFVKLTSEKQKRMSKEKRIVNSHRPF